MQRRKFLKHTLISSAGIFAAPALSKAGWFASGGQGVQDIADIEKYFFHPPDSARPWVFYMWMNGNITKEGITLDLEAMKRMGIGGAICFNSAVGIPRGHVDYAGDEWMAATVHAIQEAERLGLQLAIHNSPGYSGCGGPWVTPEMSMQQLVWTETQVKGQVSVELAKPYAKHNYYQDAMVIAYPSLSAEKGLMKDKLKSILANGKQIDKNILTDGNRETKIRLEKGYTANGGIEILLEFAGFFEARAISILRKPEIPEDLFDGPRDHPPVFHLAASADGINFRSLGRVECPALREMDTPATLSFDAVSAKYYRLRADTATWLSDIELYSGPRLGGWGGKTNNTHGNYNGETPEVNQSELIRPEQVIDLSAEMDKNGLLKWKAPAGNWTILRIGHTTTGEEPAAHPDAGKGLEIDKFRKEALDFHFKAFLDPLIGRVKPNIGKGLKGITVDSWEAGKQNWTADFPQEFLSRKNYSIKQWMPALTGRIVGSVSDTERFLWDVRKVQADLLAENFYGYYAECSHKRGLEFYAEPYGDGNLDSLKIGANLDITMSEFWTRYMYGSDTTSKQAAAVAHVYGKKIVAAEAYTAMPELSKWTDYPYSLKAEGDYFFTLGVNRLVFHTFVHQPYTTGLPGMTMGPFGMHIDRNNSWTEQASAWTGYLKRAQYLLQQGLTVADICYFKGDEPESGVPDIYKFLPFGYAGDVIGADAFHKRFSIKNNQIVLPDGMTYRICIMASLDAILPATLQRIKQLVAEGMILVVNNKPAKAYGLQGKDSEVTDLVKELYGPLDGVKYTEQVYGKGKLIWNNDLAGLFKALNIAPDFKFTAENQDATIHYIHKTIGDVEFYLLSNHKRRKEKLVVSLRTQGRHPEIWNAEDGTYYLAAVFDTENGRTRIPLELDPAAALFIVFRNSKGASFEDIRKDDSVLISTRDFGLPKPELHKALMNTFTIAAWIKPDTFARSGRSMLFHAPLAEKIYGKGHAACAVSAGQNAIRIYERTSGSAREVLTYQDPVSGWTHFALVYTGGIPALYVNGKLAATGKSSGALVHPGLDTPADQEQYTTYFEGNYTKPELFSTSFSAADVKKMFEKGLPPLQLEPPVQLFQNPSGKVNALIWKNGRYSVKKNGQQKEWASVNHCKEEVLTGTWNLQFPENSGIARQLALPELISLKDHSDFNVKHFAGTVVYSKVLIVNSADFGSGKRLFLDLGRVEVIADLQVNGKQVAILWKEPFRADVTDVLKVGKNLIAVRVTTQWHNRLIGDEHLPAENKYSVHGFIEKLPDWYVKNQMKPGDRKSFAVWKNLNAKDPLLESGLLGPVKLLVAVQKIID
ncbi:glycosyl hydrolase [Pedobacter heparinus]|uniref:glycosyl hydrolase n=1 Tax=Pedobacter heparinus TaxID=984 RepID=UPI00292F6FD2|nr:glycosyl hydrolase [Pedobacter heparinus]